MKRLCDHIESLDWSEAVSLLCASRLRDPFEPPIPMLRELLLAGASIFGHATFLKVKYPYGDLIINHGHFRTPRADQECVECTRLQHQYPDDGNVPLQLVLENNVEIFFLCKDQVVNLNKRKEEFKIGYRTVPVDIRRPGDLIGLFETLRPFVGCQTNYGSFQVSAGSRNVRVILPLAHRCDLLRRVNRESLGEYLEADTDEYFSKKPFNADWTAVACEWHLIRDACRQRQWSSSVLLFPRMLYRGEPGEPSRAGEWRNQFLLHLLAEGWAQSQPALEAFVPDDDSGMLEMPFRYFLSIDDVSAPVVLRHLTAALDGESLVWKPAGGTENGPFEDFLRWATGQGDGEQQDGYIPLILEPGRLSSRSKWGVFSFAHPIIPSSLRIKHRTDSHPDLVKGLNHALQRLAIQEHVHIQSRELGEEITAPSLKRITQWLLGMGVADCRGDKLARNRLLSNYLTLEYREKVPLLPAHSHASGKQ